MSNIIQKMLLIIFTEWNLLIFTLTSLLFTWL